MMNKRYAGQLLIEVLIGVSLIAVMTLGIVPLIMAGAGTSGQDKQITATYLAKEQIEAVKSLQEENWNNLYFPLNTSNKGLGNFYHPILSGDTWQLATGEETILIKGANYKRSLTIENVSRTGLNAAGEVETNFNAVREDPSTQKVTSTVSGFGGLPVTITEYVSRYRNQIWTQTDWIGGAAAAAWQDPPANKYFSGIDTDTIAVSGQVVLAQTGPPINDYFGNHFLNTATASIGNMTGANQRTSLRFKAEKNGNVTQLRVYIHNQKNGANVTYRYGLQADNAGNPSGVFLGSNTAVFGATGWQNVVLAAPIPVTVGTTYHIVVQYANTGQTPAANRYVGLRDSTPNNQLTPLENSANSAQNTLFFNGTAWASQNGQPIYLLGFDDGTFEGNPYDASASRLIYGNNFEGERFNLPEERTIKGIRFRISKSTSQNPNDALYVSLRDLTANQTLINNGTVVTGQEINLTTAYSWQTYATNLTLAANHNYRLYLSSPNSSSSRNYRIYAISSPAGAEYVQNTWSGNAGRTSRSANGGGAWTETDYVDMSGFDLVSVKPAYAPWGELISSTYDVQNRAGFNRLYWEVADLPSNTVIKLQLAANNDNATWSFKGPQGTASDYYVVSTGENIWTGLYHNRYVRYKIRLETTDNTVTPAAGAVRVNLSP